MLLCHVFYAKLIKIPMDKKAMFYNFFYFFRTKTIHKPETNNKKPYL